MCKESDEKKETLIKKEMLTVLEKNWILFYV